MSKANILYVGLLAGGVAIGALARDAIGTAEPAPAVQPSITSAIPDVSALPAPSNDQERAVLGMLESLSLALTQEAEYRLVLEDQIDSLSERLDDLQARVGTPASGNGTLNAQAKERQRRRTQRGGALTVDRLVNAGMESATATDFKAKVDDLAMQRLYLRDQAMREGWLGDQRYREESQRLFQAQNNLRQDFGDPAYEAYLYASGRPNRVEVQNVLDSSPAAEAGLRAGDQILSYNGNRTFQTNELRTATQQGRSGEMVPVQIVRNGQTMDIYVPRGPLGIQMTGSSERPGG
ncbi:MAG: PDZ domain-containing protein [Gammaproteobacteria bacterium]